MSRRAVRVCFRIPHPCCWCGGEGDGMWYQENVNQLIQSHHCYMWPVSTNESSLSLKVSEASVSHLVGFLSLSKLNTCWSLFNIFLQWVVWENLQRFRGGVQWGGMGWGKIGWGGVGWSWAGSKTKKTQKITTAVFGKSHFCQFYSCCVFVQGLCKGIDKDLVTGMCPGQCPTWLWSENSPVKRLQQWSTATAWALIGCGSSSKLITKIKESHFKFIDQIILK